MNEPPIPSPDPLPHATVYLQPGSGNTFYLDGHTYTLTSGFQLLEDGFPVSDGFGMRQVAFFENALYCQDNATGKWLRWGGSQFDPSPGPGISDGVPPVAPDVSLQEQVAAETKALTEILSHLAMSIARLLVLTEK